LFTSASLLSTPLGFSAEAISAPAASNRPPIPLRQHPKHSRFRPSVQGVAFDQGGCQHHQAPFDKKALAAVACFILTSVLAGLERGRPFQGVRAYRDPGGRRSPNVPGKRESPFTMSLSAKLNAGFAGAIVLLAFVGFVSYHSTATSFEQARGARDSLQVLDQLQALLATVSEAESAGRAFRLTGDETFLDACNRTVEAVPGQLTELRRLTLDSTAQRAYLNDLEPAVAAKLAQLNRSIDQRRRHGFEPAVQHQLTQEGAVTQRLIRTIIHRMRSEEQRVLDERAASAERAARRALTLIPAGSTVALLLITLALLRIRHDLRERQSADRALRESEASLQSVLNAATEVSIVATDSRGIITVFNSGAERMLGYSAEEMIGKRTPEIIHLASELEERGRQLSAAAGRPIRGFEVFVYEARQGGHDLREWTYVRKDGRHVAVSLVVTAARDANGEISGYLGIAIDITERRMMAKMKDEFISMVSHELRTPLASIRGALGLMAGGVVDKHPDKARQMMAVAVSNTERLGRLIDDILEIERLESGSVVMTPQSRPAEDLLQQAVATMRPMADNARVELRIDGTATQVYADPDRVLHTLTNLIDNAIKFSPPNSTVTVAAQRQGSEILFKVQDEGRGIPSDKLEAVFERLAQLDSSDSREKGGTGLGLPICRMIVQQHGGRIWAESGEGRGTTFFFTLPAADEIPTAPSEEDSPQPSEERKRHNAG